MVNSAEIEGKQIYTIQQLKITLNCVISKSVNYWLLYLLKKTCKYHNRVIVV